MKLLIGLFVLVTMTFAQGSYLSDPIAVRAILDSNGLYDISVETATQTNSEGRINQLYIRDTNFKHIPSEITALTELQAFDISSAKISELPEAVCNLSKLIVLYLDFNKLTVLPDSIGKLGNLEYLSIYYNEVDTLPESLLMLNNIVMFIVGGNYLCETNWMSIDLQTWMYIYSHDNELSGSGFWMPSQRCAKAEETSFVAKNVELIISPNPFSDKTIISANNQVIHSLRVYNAKGQLIHSMENVNCHQMQWVPKNATAGIYVIKVKASSGMLTRHVVYLQ